MAFTALACGFLGIATPDIGSISTAAAQTVIAGLTQNIPPVVFSPTPATPTLTFTLQPPAFTPTQTLTPTATPTITPLIPYISVSVPTNCRNGPGKIYDMVGALLVGETAQVTAREPTGRYWYIPNPDTNGEYCWVWGEYATLSGNVALLPIYTPPPTPTFTMTPTPTFTPAPAPDLKVSYTSLDTCTGWWVEFKLKNTGSIIFKSVEVRVTDTVTAITISNLTDGFTDINGCLSTTTKDSLSPDNSTIVSAPAFTYNPTGHLIQARVTVCSNTGQNGLCATRKIEFTP